MRSSANMKLVMMVAALLISVLQVHASDTMLMFVGD